MAGDNNSEKISRRELFRRGTRIVTAAIVGGGALFAVSKSRTEATVWQIDPNICIQCGNCSINCVLEPSSVKCVHAFAICGYCDLCSGYFRQNALALDTAAENRLCPTGAINEISSKIPIWSTQSMRASASPVENASRHARHSATALFSSRCVTTAA